MNTPVELLQVSCGAGVGRCRSCQKTKKVCRHSQPQTSGSVVFFTPDLPRNRTWKPTSVASIFRMAAPIAPKFCSHRQASMNVQIGKNANDRKGCLSLKEYLNSQARYCNTKGRYQSQNCSFSKSGYSLSRLPLPQCFSFRYSCSLQQPVRLKLVVRLSSLLCNGKYGQLFRLE